MTKTLTEQYSNVVFLKDDQTQMSAYTFATMKPDYSKMYFEFQFKDGEKARYRMDKDCHDFQQFLDRMNHFHDLEKENKHMQEQLYEANEVIRYYDIKEPKYVENGVVVAKDPAHRYLEKWGVK